MKTEEGIATGQEERMVFEGLKATTFTKLGILLLIFQASSPGLWDTETAFRNFKGLQGKWAIKSGGKILPIEMSYDVASKGSIVTEQFGKELSVFYPDGQSLKVIHFCNAGNQPRLRLKEGGQPGLLEFEMFDITNLKSEDAAHVQRIIYRILDDKRFELEIVWQRGEAQEFERYSLTRI